MQDEELKEKASHFKSLGIHNIMRNREERLAFLQFHDDINFPIKRQGCSSCFSQSYYTMEDNLRKYLELKKIKGMATDKTKYSLRKDVPNIRAYDGNVYNGKTLTQEIAQGMVKRYPKSWQTFFDVDVTPSKPKATKATKKEEDVKEDK